MSFIWPTMLFILVAIPILVLLYLLLQRRRRKMIAHYGSLGLTQSADGQGLGWRRHIPPLLFMIGLTILIVALARPQAEVSLPRVEGTIILAFDVSGSMAADDLQPTRMDAAKAAALHFIDKQPGSILLGVVAFSDSGISVQVPTTDKEAVIAAVKRLSPQRGTSLANGILASLTTIAAGANPPTNYYSNLTPQPTLTPTAVPPGIYTPAAIILLTDGENNQNPDPLAAAQAAAYRGVRIYPIGIGSAAGTILHVNGFLVHTQLDEALLQQIAQLTDGTYYTAENEAELQKVYDELTPQLVIKPEHLEVTSIFAGASILVLLIGGVFSLLWFSRLP